MPDIINLFPLSVYREPQPIDPSLREQLVQAVFEMSAQPVMKQSSGSSWTGDVNGFELLHKDPRFAPLFELMPAHLRRYLDVLGVNPEKVHLYYTRAWATVARGPEKIYPHNHLQSHISLVYYLKKPPDSGGISFMNQEAPNQFAPQIFRDLMLKFGVLKEMHHLNALSVDFFTNESDILIFPSRANL